MTFHTSTPTGRLARRAAIGLVALGLLLSGCSTGTAAVPAAITPSATPTADPHDVAIDIGATFPTQAEWLEDYEGGTWCTAETPGPDSCGTDAKIPNTLSQGVNLRADATGVTARAVVLQVWEFDSAETALVHLGGIKDDDSAFAGDFDIPLDAEAGTTTGSRGAGTLDDLERNGWAGYRLSQVSVTTYADGTFDPTASSTNSIVLTNGPLAFMVRLYSASAEPGVADAEVNGWLDRVLGPEESD